MSATSTPSKKTASSNAKRPRDSPFTDGTVAAEWTASSSSAAYIIRHVPAETCCMAPWGSTDGWPTITVKDDDGEDDSEGEGSDEEDEGGGIQLAVIGAVYRVSDGEFVAFWGADDGDGHVEFYVSDAFAEDGDAAAALGFDGLSHELCTKICPALIDVFDDGSGSERDVTIVPKKVLSSCADLATLYESTSSDEKDE